MNRRWKFVTSENRLPLIDGWYYVIDSTGMEYKDFFYATAKKFAINNDIKAWSECYE